MQEGAPWLDEPVAPTQAPAFAGAFVFRAARRTVGRMGVEFFLLARAEREVAWLGKGLWFCAFQGDEGEGIDPFVDRSLACVEQFLRKPYEPDDDEPPAAPESAERRAWVEARARVLHAWLVRVGWVVELGDDMGDEDDGCRTVLDLQYGDAPDFVPIENVEDLVGEPLPTPPWPSVEPSWFGLRRAWGKPTPS